MTERAYVDLAEFVDCGYLQELNRLFLHPLGLALELTRSDDGHVEFSGILDARDDPEGFVFSDDAESLSIRVAKAATIKTIWDERQPARIAAVGEMVQPL
jgi:hypothetical protein